MIEHIKHKGLKKFWYQNDTSLLPPARVERIKMILNLIEETEIMPDDLIVFHTLELHQLKGDLKGFWSISVSGNFRIIFKFDNQNKLATNLDLVDYH